MDNSVTSMQQLKQLRVSMWTLTSWGNIVDLGRLFDCELNILDL